MLPSNGFRCGWNAATGGNTATKACFAAGGDAAGIFGRCARHVGRSGGGGRAVGALLAGLVFGRRRDGLVDGGTVGHCVQG